MTNPERGTYEPRVETIRPFDPNDEDADQDEVSRLPLLVAIALVVLTAFAGVVWLAYTQGVERGRAEAPRVIIARSAPEKPVPPPYTGLKIYQPAAPARQEARTASAVAARPTPSKPRSSVAAPSSAPSLRPSAVGAPESVSALPQSASASSRQTAPLMPQTTTVPAAPAASPTVPRTATRPPTRLGAPATAVAAVSPPTVPASAAASHAVSNGVLLQIGSYKSDAEARAAWKAFQASHGIAAAYLADVKQVDLGAKGIWYRLRMAGFSDKDSAIAACEKLKADGASCLIAR